MSQPEQSPSAAPPEPPAQGEASSSANDEGDARANMDLVMQIPVTLSMEIGRTQMRIEDLLNLSRGSVVELERMVDEPLDVLVNGTLIAHAEAVVVDGRFGIRLTDVVSRQQRLSQLR